MMNKKNKHLGFTLIELLVVVAIIALLVSVVMAAMDIAKKKGADASVKSNLDTLRSVAELFNSNNNNSYLPAGGATFPIDACPTYDITGNGTNMFTKSKTISDAIAQAVKSGITSSCYDSDSTWSVAVGLLVDPTTSWCVDNTGAARVVASIPSGAINSTTGLCN